MSLSPVESLLALNSSNTRIEISLCNFMICFLDTEYHRGLELLHRSFFFFLVRPSLTAHLHDISNLLYTIYVKGITWTFKDVPLISRICLADIGLIQRTFPCINATSFRILYWHDNFHDLNLIEEVWNIIKRRCEPLPNNKFSTAMEFCAEEQIMKLHYENMPMQ